MVIYYTDFCIFVKSERVSASLGGILKIRWACFRGQFLSAIQSRQSFNKAESLAISSRHF